MRNFERNRRSKNLLESKPVLLLLGIIVLVFAWSVWRFSHKMTETSRNKTTIQAKTETLREQKATLLADIQKLATDRGKEEFFRENFGLARVGEEVVIIVEEKNLPPEPKQNSFSGFFSFLRNLFR